MYDIAKLFIQKVDKSIRHFSNFHIFQCIFTYPVAPGQRILMLVVSFGSEMNKAINKGYLMKFRRCIFHM